jgi:hypothetical protein
MFSWSQAVDISSVNSNKLHCSGVCGSTLGTLVVACLLLSFVFIVAVDLVGSVLLPFFSFFLSFSKK